MDDNLNATATQNDQSFALTDSASGNDSAPTGDEASGNDGAINGTGAETAVDKPVSGAYEVKLNQDSTSEDINNALKSLRPANPEDYDLSAMNVLQGVDPNLDQDKMKEIQSTLHGLNLTKEQSEGLISWYTQDMMKSIDRMQADPGERGRNIRAKGLELWGEDSEAKMSQLENLFGQNDKTFKAKKTLMNSGALEDSDVLALLSDYAQMKRASGALPATRVEDRNMGFQLNKNVSSMIQKKNGSEKNSLNDPSHRDYEKENNKLALMQAKLRLSANH